MADFIPFKTAVREQLATMLEGDLFRTDVTGDELWATYLDSFPPGSNPVFRERTEHDCSCCRQFIRTIGNVVTVRGGELVSIWDGEIADPYAAVSRALAELVRSRPIVDAFLHYENHVGTDKNFENGDVVLTWEHFHVELPVRRNRGRDLVVDKASIPATLGDFRTAHDVLARGLREITLESIDTVLELIGQNSLYRGEEHRGVLTAFRKLKDTFEALPVELRNRYVWLQAMGPAAVSRIRNTVIGELLAELSTGTDLEAAVGKFEAMVAPTSYRRPTALVTQGMVDKARDEVMRLGLSDALHRRHARASDVSINNVIFADRSTRQLMRDVFSTVPTRASRVNGLGDTIAIEAFLGDVVPSATSIEVLFENRHVGNLVSLIAPERGGGPPLFKWDNNFSWSYKGELADSIKERVKAAGGNVAGDLRCSLAWYNYDDLDLHLREAGGFHIFYVNKRSPTGGRLDVDMNAGYNPIRTPVENIFYADRRTMREGIYDLFVHQYHKREVENGGFEVEVDFLGTTTTFIYDKPLKQGQTVAVAKFKYDGQLEFIETLPPSTRSKTLWNLPTGTFHKVNLLMLSPNYWDEQRGIGNKHYLFALDGCVNDEPARGFYNEFLRPELDQHRKVLELVGSRTRIEPTPHQLSGLGFSSTQRAELTARIDEGRTFKITF